MKKQELVLSLNNGLDIGGELTGTGWNLPSTLTVDEWTKAGELLAKVEQSKQWWLGDWWNAGTHYGERETACEAIGFEYETAAKAGTVSKNFENFCRRRQNLTFSHHREVCVIKDPAVQDRMLDWCEEPIESTGKPRSTSELREQIRAYLDEQGWSKEDKKRRDALKRGETLVANQKTDEKLIRWAQFEGKAAKVDRGSDWGNPFYLPEDGDRDQVCDSYAVYLDLKPSLLVRLSELKGKLLLCWCHPERCHAHKLAELANEADE